MQVGGAKGVTEGGSRGRRRRTLCLGHIDQRKKRIQPLVIVPSNQSNRRFLGITITKLSQSFSYDVQGGSVVATKSCTASSVNFNIAVALSDDTSHWVQGSHGVCETTWHGNIFFKGFGVRLDKIQHLEVDARGIYNTWLVNA